MHILTVDVEEWFDGFLGGAEAGLPLRAERQVQSLLEMLDEHRATATFFWLGTCARRYPKLLREVHSRGHHIGAHGDTHAHLATLGERAFTTALDRATTDLEHAIGEPITAFRAPYFSITRQTQWALDVLIARGYRFDSSIFPAKHWRYGWNDFPNRITTIERAGGTIIEVPPTMLTFSRARVPACGGAYFRLLPYRITAAQIRQCQHSGSPSVFYLHPWELDAEQPRMSGRSLETIPHYFRLSSTTSKLRRLLGEFQFGSIHHVLNEHVPSYTIPQPV